MKTSIIVVLAAIGLMSAPFVGTAAAKSAPRHAAGEQLLLPPYPGTVPWKKITNHRDAVQIWFEWIPNDQNENDIKDILTEQVFFRFKHADPGAFVTDLLRRVAGACRGATHAGPIARTELGYAVAYAQTYCVGAQDKDVDIFIKAIGGNDGLYVIQREFRRPATPGAMPGVQSFSKDEIPEGKAAFTARQQADSFLADQVRLCPHGIDGDRCVAPADAP